MIRVILFTIGFVLGLLTCWAMADGGLPAGTWAPDTGLFFLAGLGNDANSRLWSEATVVVDNRFNASDLTGVYWWVETSDAEADALPLSEHNGFPQIFYYTIVPFRDQQVGDLLWTGVTLYDGSGHFYPKFFWFDVVTEDSGEATDGVIPAGCTWVSSRCWLEENIYVDGLCSLAIVATGLDPVTYHDTEVNLELMTPGDADWDGDVDLDDFIFFQAGYTAQETFPAWWEGDFDGDYDVDLDDFATLKANFGS